MSLPLKLKKGFFEKWVCVCVFVKPFCSDVWCLSKETVTRNFPPECVNRFQEVHELISKHGVLQRMMNMALFSWNHQLDEFSSSNKTLLMTFYGSRPLFFMSNNWLLRVSKSWWMQNLTTYKDQKQKVMLGFDCLRNWSQMQRRWQEEETVFSFFPNKIRSFSSIKMNSKVEASGLSRECLVQK